MADNPRLEELRRRVQADPASIAFAALAEEFRRVGRYEDAIETCRTGLQRHPAYLSARVTLGRALIEVGEYTDAREELETVLRSAPENLAALRGLEQINERLGHSTEMHPDLHVIARQAKDAEDARIAAAPPPPPPPPSAPTASTFAPSAPIASGDKSVDGSGGKPPVIAFEASTIAFEAPVTHIEPVPVDAPDPHVAATLLRLERFLGAIRNARHA